MRPLVNPPIQEVTVEGILHALSDPLRVEIFIKIASAECSKTCCSFHKLKGKELAKSTLSHHFKILRDAGLIRSERCGVEMHNTSRCSELKQRFGPLVDTIISVYLNQDIKRKRSGRRSAAKR